MEKETVPSDPKIELTTIAEILEQLAQKYPAISLMENGNESSFDVAEIVSLDDNWVKLHCYGTKKTLSRIKKIVSYETFSRIEFDSLYIKQIVNLHKRVNN